MTQSLNQFGMKPEVGDVFDSPYEGVRSARATEDLSVGQAVIFATPTAGKMVSVKKATVNDKNVRFVLRNINRNGAKKNDIVEIGISGMQILLKAGSAIAANQEVKITANAGEVVPATGTDIVSGFAVTDAAANETVVVEIK